MIVVEIAHQRRQPVRPSREQLSGIESTVAFSIKYPQAEWIFLRRNVQNAVAIEVADDNVPFGPEILGSRLEGSVSFPRNTVTKSPTTTSRFPS